MAVVSQPHSSLPVDQVGDVFVVWNGTDSPVLVATRVVYTVAPVAKCSVLFSLAVISGSSSIGSSETALAEQLELHLITLKVLTISFAICFAVVRILKPWIKSISCSFRRIYCCKISSHVELFVWSPQLDSWVSFDLCESHTLGFVQRLALGDSRLTHFAVEVYCFWSNKIEVYVAPLVSNGRVLFIVPLYNGPIRSWVLFQTSFRFTKCILDCVEWCPTEVSWFAVIIIFALRAYLSEGKTNCLVWPVAHGSTSQTIVAVDMRRTGFQKASSFTLERFRVAHSGMALKVVCAHSTVIQVFGNLLSGCAVLRDDFAMDLTSLPSIVNW